MFSGVGVFARLTNAGSRSADSQRLGDLLAFELIVFLTNYSKTTSKNQFFRLRKSIQVGVIFLGFYLTQNVKWTLRV